MISVAITGFLVLTVLELVLGIDNIIFISLVCDRLPPEKQKMGRNIGLTMAMLLRIVLLFGLNLIIQLEEPLISVWKFDLSGRDLILLGGGIFLIYKTTTEIHDKMEKEEYNDNSKDKPLTVTNAVIQITLLNMVFSFDSILTAIGLVTDIKDQMMRNYVMIGSVIASMILMMFFSKYISDFVNKHPTVKMLAMSFLLMIGTLLILESFHVKVEKAYVYFAMAFSFAVELLNMRMRKKHSK
jgi:predicted tellurium resistance membrane protein TerC